MCVTTHWVLFGYWIRYTQLTQVLGKEAAGYGLAAKHCQLSRMHLRQVPPAAPAFACMLSMLKTSTASAPPVPNPIHCPLAVDPETLPPPDIRGTLREPACGHVH